MKQYQQQWLNRLNQCIERHIDDSSFSANRLAFLMDISIASLHRKMKKLCNCTPAKYIRRMRLQLAQSLVDSGKPIRIVARKIGYNKVNHLASLLKGRSY